MLQPLYFVFLATLVWSTYSQANDQAAVQLDVLLNNYEQAAVLLKDANGAALYAFNEQQPMVPASTVKLLTGLIALEHWGGDFQAETEFYFDMPSKSLRVVGSGDPFLVSEEIAVIATQLKLKLNSLSAHLPEENGIKSLVVDYSRFKNQSELLWQGNTSNPYDAIPSALAANFNTLNFKLEEGRPVSAEEQTPLTHLSWLKAEQTVNGEPTGRVNTGSDVSIAARYFGELLLTFLWQQGVSMVDTAGQRHSRSDKSLMDPASTRLLLAERVSTVSDQTVNEATQLLYTHNNSRELKTVVAAMLQYSTNFIANNVALMLASERFKGPAGFTEYHRLVQNYVLRRFGWTNTVLEEGAGLSRANRLSGEQLVQLVDAYNEWPDLIPIYKNSIFNDSVFAKTGSLSNVSTLAGSIVADNGKDYKFAILLQDSSISNSSARDKILTLLKGIVDKRL